MTLLPTDLLPSAFGLRWGMSQESCLRVLQVVPHRQHSMWAAVMLRVGEEDHEVVFQFGGHDALQRIRVDLYESRSFWDSDPEWTDDELHELWEGANELYHSLLSHYAEILGPPVYSGNQWLDEKGYPYGEIADTLTYWSHSEGRLQLTKHQQDQECPIMVSLDCYQALPENEPPAT